MAEITKTTSKIAQVYPGKSEVLGYKTAVAVTAGQAVTLNTSGLLVVADANDAAANTFIGIALESVGAGVACPVLMAGYVSGFTVSSLNAMAPVYLSDDAGKVDTAAGTVSVVVGFVGSLPDGTKCLYVAGR
ncbi:hypothetical protein ADN00_15730 [Ornatilinea apprima]|uniref:DUF2190 family protein n=1 Tax=Ornatilinea apprima TaxID=1134406 RepID=A0A0N8GLE4_9CHLR|nr:hypothetical protein [Ornatilinea apprima]KPL72266.1 hypothetical protein ADN00_15730 [Ornatilinea apprima]